MSQKGASLTTTLFAWEWAYLMGISGDTSDDKFLLKKLSCVGEKKKKRLFKFFRQQRKVAYPNCIPDILLHKAHTLHSLGLGFDLYKRNEKQFIFAKWRHIHCYETILVCSLFSSLSLFSETTNFNYFSCFL